jgi:hypothetical protein
MNKKILSVSFIMIILVAAIAGCFGEEKKSPPPGPNFREIPGETLRETGWIDSDMGDNEQRVDSSVPVAINSTEKVTLLEIRMNFDDSDGAHTESDEGSDPDEVTIFLTNGVNQSDSVSGTTPCNLLLQMNGTEGSFMSGSWEVNVMAVCGAGKPYTVIPRPGMISFLQYKDQGIAYDLEVKYSMLIVGE